MTAPPAPPSPAPPPGDARNAPRHDILARLVPPLVHRLNNCLAVVEGTLDVLADDSEGMRVETAQLEARRIGRLLAGLTTLARDHHAAGTTAPGTVDLAALLGDATELVGPYLERAGVRLDVRTALAGAVIRGSAPLLFQLVVCALVEAAGPLRPRFGPAAAPTAPPHRACVSTVGDGRRVTLRIASTGALPEALVRGDLARFCAEVAEEHGASLRVRGPLRGSREGGGAFACQLLFPPSVVVGAPLAVTPRPARARLLLLETTSELGGLISAVLEGVGYRVDVVTSAARALATLTPAHAALLVDGENAREGDASLRDLVADELEAQVAWLGEPPGLDVGACPCLAAPFTPGALIAFVEELVG